ncbi:MAG: acyl-ACP--UDP-N-acetylglucosamine O-acyltransferase [Pseudomonadaceae bacterium]|nr:acyl-ACP--UDP-N-acetylglucosamine O-acyltransferase [Pseudomonadaceae bacterium]
MIDARCQIDPSAVIGNNVEIGPWTLIGPDVEIGDDCWIAPHVIIRGPTRIGSGNRIYQFATVGDDTPATAYNGEPTWLVVGDNNIIREGVTIHRGMVQDDSKTVIGSNNLLMAYVHVGHDCVLGDNIVLSNNASLSGHVTVGDYANFGGYSGVPQYRAIGAYTHIAAMSLVVKDVPAYMTVSGQPARAVGLNSEGMKRRGYSADVMSALKRAHRTVYRRGLTTQEALAELAQDAAAYPEVALFADSIASSRWGIVRPKS